VTNRDSVENGRRRPSFHIPGPGLYLPILMSTISLKIEFGGGLELLFSNKRSYRLTLPAAVPKNNTTDVTNPIVEPTKPIDITYLIHYLKDHMLKDRVELFMEKGTV
jgi:ubiquitin related modifier 1